MNKKEEMIKELLKEMNEVNLYDTLDEKGNMCKAIKCETVCAILTVLIDKYFE